MTNEELRRALGLLAAQHAKLLSKPKRDFWDKIAVFVPLATGIVVTVTSVILTYRIQSIQTQAAENRKVVEQQAAEKKIEGERLAAEQRAAVEREAAERQRQFQQGLARTELLGKMIPFLIAKDGSADMALVAVTLTKDGEMMEAITRMMPRNAATAMLAKVSEASGTTAELRDRASAVLGDIAEQSAEGESTWGSRALIVALRELKQKVREEPSGSNRGARIDEYHRATGFEPGHSWSGIFVKYCFQQAVPEGTTAPATLQPPFGSIRAELTVKRFWRAANDLWTRDYSLSVARRHRREYRRQVDNGYRRQHEGLNGSPRRRRRTNPATGRRAGVWRYANPVGRAATRSDKHRSVRAVARRRRSAPVRHAPRGARSARHSVPTEVESHHSTRETAAGRWVAPDFGRCRQRSKIRRSWSHCAERNGIGHRPSRMNRHSHRRRHPRAGEYEANVASGKGFELAATRLVNG
jgi:hypothetical protein